MSRKIIPNEKCVDYVIAGLIKIYILLVLHNSKQALTVAGCLSGWAWAWGWTRQWLTGRAGGGWPHARQWYLSPPVLPRFSPLSRARRGGQATQPSHHLTHSHASPVQCWVLTPLPTISSAMIRSSVAQSTILSYSIRRPVPPARARVWWWCRSTRPGPTGGPGRGAAY